MPRWTRGKPLSYSEQARANLTWREPDEIPQGSPAGAHRIARSYLELRIEDAAPDVNRT